jgi:katanin p80 WD40 repeat-containing subunit B1
MISSGPVRCIYFHPEGECLFSGTADGLRVHGWEPTRTFDSLGLGWGRLADLATASHQLIGASYAQCHVAIYVVDLKRVQPFCGVNIPEKEPRQSGGGAVSAGATATGQADPHRNVTFRTGQTVRRSFVRDNKPGSGGSAKSGSAQQAPPQPPQVKIAEETSDKSGTEGEDSDAVSHADIPDINHYETIFRPRNRELNRTPPADEPFEAPPGGTELELMPMPVRAADPTAAAAFYGSNKHLAKSQQKVVSPSPPTRRASQPAMYSATAVAVAAAVPGGFPSSGGGGGSGSRRGSTTGLHLDVMRPQEVHLRGAPHSGTVSSQPPQRPYSVYGGEGESSRSGGGSGRTASVPREFGPPGGSPVRAAYRTAIPLGGASDQPEEYLPDSLAPHPGTFSPPLPPQHHQPSVPYPVPGSPASPSRHYPPPAVSPTKAYSSAAAHSSFSGGGGGLPLDRPTAVRPHRASEGSNPYYYYQQQQRGNMQTPVEDAAAAAEDLKLIPAMADRPSGLNTSDFLPQKFGGLKIGLSTSGGGSRGSVHHSPQHQGSGGGGGGGFGFDWPVQLSESEVTSSILRDHTNVAAVLRMRHRHLEVVRQLWQTKDAKTAVEQAVDYADPAVVVDLLSVIVLRPSIWNLDLCLHLLPPIAELLLSKYESYVSGAAAALKLILKNFGAVIRTNIDSPTTSVGVDISKEERLNKCLDCYRELVKIRSAVLKRQTLQGKCGHAFRELAILMQVLD